MSTLFYQMVDVADELTEPHLSRVSVPYWDANRNRKFREHRITMPGLLAQLYDAAVDPVAAMRENGRSKPTSQAPLAIEALSRYEDICAGALRWVRAIRVDVRTTPQSNIRALVGVAPTFDLDTLEALYAEMRTWHRWAAVMTGWESQVFRPRIACPVCETPGSIRARAIGDDKKLAYCSECQAHWQGAELDAMAGRIRSAA